MVANLQKKFFLVFGFLLFPVLGFAAPGDLEWEEVITHPSGFGYGYGAMNDNTGVYIIGASHHQCAGGWYYGHGARWYVEKRNTDGSLGWRHSDSHTGTSDCAFEIDMDSTGVYISGVTNAGAGIAGGSDWRIEKRSKSNGIVLWEDDLQAAQHANGWSGKGTALNVTTSGVYAVAPASRGGNTHAFTMKYNKTNGVREWARNTARSSPLGVAVSGSNVYTVGADWSGGSDRWLIEKRNANNGGLNWTRTPDHGSSVNYAAPLYADATGVVAASAHFAGDPYHMEKWNSAGTRVWQEPSSGVTYDTPITPQYYNGIQERAGNILYKYSLSGNWMSGFTLSLTARDLSTGATIWNEPLLAGHSRVGAIWGSDGMYALEKDSSQMYLVKRNTADGSAEWTAPGLSANIMPVGIEGNDQFIYTFRTDWISNDSSSISLQKWQLDGAPPTIDSFTVTDPVNYNDPATISWSTSNADGCTATAGPGFDTGSTANGSDTSDPLTSDPATFSIECKNSVGDTVTDSRTITVNEPTVVFSGSGCTIATGDTTCDGSLTWDFDHTPDPNIYDTRHNTTVSTDPADTNAPVTLEYGNTTFEARNGTTVLPDGTVHLSAGCGAGDFYDGTGCGETPDVSLSVDPETIRRGDTADVEVTVDGNYDLDCELYGVDTTPITFTHPGGTGAQTYPYTTRSLSSEQIVTIQCTHTPSSYQVSTEARISVVGSLEEI